MTCCGYPRSSWFCPECGKRLIAAGANVRPNPQLSISPEQSASRPWPNYWVKFTEEVQAKNVYFDRSRLVNLPFIPMVGMMIEGVFWVNEEDAFDRDICDITDVYYSLVEGRFDCTVDSSGKWTDREIFTVQDAKEMMDFGCRLDDETSLQEWIEYVQKRGHVVPESDPTEEPRS